MPKTLYLSFTARTQHWFRTPESVSRGVILVDPSSISRRSSSPIERLISRPRNPRTTSRTFKRAERQAGKLPGWSDVATMPNPGGQLASRQHFDFAFLGAFARLSVPSSPSSSHLNATSDPTNGRSARNAPAHPSGRSSALLLRPFRPRIGRFSSSFFSTSSYFIPPSWISRVDSRFGFKEGNLFGMRVKSFKEVHVSPPIRKIRFAHCLYKTNVMYL